MLLNSLKFFVGVCLAIMVMSCTDNQLTSSKGAKVEALPVSKPISTNLHNGFKIGYQLNQPVKVINLAKELLELSALSYWDNKDQLLTVNDEKANIYLLDSNTGDIQASFDFGKKGDYEGIEIVNTLIYVLKANGNLYTFNPKEKESEKSYKTPLSVNNDVEGLGYNKNKHQLILACKGSPELKGHPKLKKTKAFYSFSLDNHQLDPKPAFVLEDMALTNFYKKKYAEKKSKTAFKKAINRIKSFSPSAIALHPSENLYYILSSVGRLLIIVGQEGAIKDIQLLDPDLFSQPEGICFAPNGTLFISNEGRSLIAKILSFNYKS